jgi:osmoprotectant transport system ATP-binding protein
VIEDRGERRVGIATALFGPELPDTERPFPMSTVVPRGARTDLHEPAVARQELVGMERPRGVAVLHAQTFLEQIGMGVGLDDAPTIATRAGERGDHGPGRRVIPTDHDGRDAGVQREDEVQSALGDRQRRHGQTAADLVRDSAVNRRAGVALLLLAQHVVVEKLRNDEDVADVDHPQIVRVRGPIGIFREERRSNGLRSEVRAAAKACPHVGRDTEHEGARASEPAEAFAKALADLLVGRRAVERTLQAFLSLPAGRDEEQSSSRRPQKDREFFERRHASNVPRGPTSVSLLRMVSLEDVSKSFGSRKVLRTTSLRIAAGERLAIIGPSGCGKSTILRLVLGLVSADEGRVKVGELEVTNTTAHRVRRAVGYVIQDGGLFPHLTAEENVTLVARLERREPSAIAMRIRELSELARLPASHLLRYPRALSGGERQRVGLMRALMLEPDVLLLDEPLGALDPIVRARLQEDLLEVFRTLDKCVLLVTHDMAEAAYLADSIAIVHDGRVVQRGSMRDLLERPADPFVTEFVGAQKSLAGSFQ